METNIERFDASTGLMVGTVGPYDFEAHVLPEGSTKGINGGRCASLCLTDSNREPHANIVAYFNGFWTVEPQTYEAQEAFGAVLGLCDTAPPLVESPTKEDPSAATDSMAAALSEASIIWNALPIGRQDELNDNISHACDVLRTAAMRLAEETSMTPKQAAVWLTSVVWDRFSAL